MAPYEKSDPEDKTNYLQISVLLSLPKVCEKILYKQLKLFCETKLCPHLSGFCSRYGTRYALSNLQFNWQNCLDKSGVIGTILMDVSKAFDCLKLKRSYISNRPQRIKFDSVFSSWIKTIIRVSQGSILGPLIYYCIETTENAIKYLQSDLKIVLNWFRNNHMMANLGEFQYMLLGKHKPLKIEIEGFQPESPKLVNLLGITIDHNLIFDTHIPNICKRARTKVKQN